MTIDDENKMELIKSAKDISYIGKSFCDGFKEGLKEQEDEQRNSN